MSEKIVLEGEIACISPLIPFQKFLSLFLEIRVISSTHGRYTDIAYITLIGNHISSQFAAAGKVGRCYRFDDLVVSSASQSSSVDSSTNSWLHGLETCIITDISANLNLQPDELLSLEVSNITVPQFIQPETLDQLRKFGEQCYFLRGHVRKLYPEGWLEIETQNQGRRFCQFCIVLTQYQVTEVTQHVVPGALVRVSWLLPVYLWGKLRGFSATIRSRLTVISPAAGETAQNSAAKECRLKIPSDILNRCRMYSLWRFLLHRFLPSVLCKGTRVETSFEQLVAHSLLDSDVTCAAGRHASLLTMCANKYATAESHLPTPAPREEFARPWLYRLPLLSAGMDPQWLSSQLPKLYSLSKMLQAGLVAFNSRRHELVAAALSPVSNNNAEFQYGWSGHLSDNNSSSVWHAGMFDRPIHHAPATSDAVDPSGVLDAASEVVVGQVLDLELAWCAPLSKYCVACQVTDSVMEAHCRGSDPPTGDGAIAQGAAVLLFYESPESQRLSEYKAIKRLMEARKTGTTSATVSPSTVVCLIKSPVLLLERSPGSSSYQRVSIISPRCAGDVQILVDSDRHTHLSESQGDALNDDVQSRDVAESIDTSVHIASWIQNVLMDTLGAPKPHSSTPLSVATQSAVGQQTECLSVRQLLMRIPKNCVLRDAVVGVVVYKGLFTDSNQFSSKRQRTERQCRLVVRDIDGPDVVTLYLDQASLASAIPLGSVAVFHSCLFNAAGSNKFVYLKIVAGVSRMGVLGVLPLDQLQRLSAHFPSQIPTTHKSTSIAKRIETYGGVKAKDGLPTVHDTFSVFVSPYTELGRLSGGLLSIPVTTQRSLADTCNSNRCVWRVLSHIVCIKTLGVYLRCSNCLAPITGAKGGATGGGLARSQYACVRCQSNITLRPHWQAQIVLDDGTSECLLHVEDQVVLQLLRTLPPRPKVVAKTGHKFDEGENEDPWAAAMLSRAPTPAPLSDLVSTLEAACCQFGKVEYNDFVQFTYRKKYFVLQKDEASTSTDFISSATNDNGGGGVDGNMSRNDDKAVKSSSSSSTHWVAPTDLSNAEEALFSYINSRSVNVPVQVVGKLLFQKAASSTYGSSSSGSFSGAGPMESITVRCQENNTHAPWLASFASVSTQARSRLTMDALFLQALHRPEDITLQTELLLAQLR